MTHYIIVRDDLDRGMTAAQVTHAAGESSPGNLKSGTIAVVLGVSPTQLVQVCARLAETHLDFTPIIEGDGLYTGQLMAIGLKPAPKEDVYPHVKRLPLLR